MGAGAGALALSEVARSSPAARRLRTPVLLPAAAYLVLVTADYAHGVCRGFLSNDGIDRNLWLAQAAVLGLLAFGVGRPGCAGGGRARVSRGS